MIEGNAGKDDIVDVDVVDGEYVVNIRHMDA